MIKIRFKMFLVLLHLTCLIALFFIVLSVHAEKGGSKKDSRTGAWYQTEYGTSPWGGTWMMGQFGPDYGIGQQGVRYESTDPLTGTFTSYSSMGLGMGLGGTFAGYGDWDSSLAAISYGPFAYGNTPQVMSIPGWGTQGSESGSLFAPQTSFYQAQPGLSWMFGRGFGEFGSYSGFGGILPSTIIGRNPMRGYGFGEWAIGYGWW